MPASKWIFFVRFLICFPICSSSEDLQEIKAKSGDDVPLWCWGTRDAAIELLEWSRPDLNPRYVLYIRENRTYENFQHPSFHGRVKLRDPQMNDGDASVILKNVNNNDTGTYECRIIMNNTGSIRTDTSELISNIILKVEDSGHNKDGADKGGHVGLTVSLSVVAVLLVAGIIGFVIFRKRKGLTEQY